MSSQQELISAVRSMQANAQANLPVIPNNGNPNGAYNAPRQAAQQPMPVKKGFDLSWLQPSPAMLQMQENLSRRQGYLDDMLTQIRAGQTQPNPTPTAPMPQLPQMNSTQMPTMPRGNVAGGVVLPSTGMNTGIIPPHMQQTTGPVIPQLRTV